MGQLLGDKGRADGRKLSAVLNGPGLPEAAGYAFVRDYAAAYSRAEEPAGRHAALADLLADDVVVHGLGCETQGKQAFLAWNEAQFAAFPDLFMTVIGTPVSGWSMVAFKWHSVGSQRAVYDGRMPKGRTAVTLTGQAVMRLDADRRAREIWFNPDPVAYQPL